VLHFVSIRRGRFRAARLLAASLLILIAGFALAWRLYYPGIEAVHAALEQRFQRTLLYDRDQIAGIIILGGTPERG
jgi:hypothetical protein